MINILSAIHVQANRDNAKQEYAKYIFNETLIDYQGNVLEGSAFDPFLCIIEIIDVFHLVTNFPCPKLNSGKYTTDWRAMASDGHVIKGKFTFEVSSYFFM